MKNPVTTAKTLWNRQEPIEKEIVKFTFVRFIVIPVGIALIIRKIDKMFP